MDIVMLAAGTSSRMGKTNKMLLPYNGTALVNHCCLEALRFLERHSKEIESSCRLIVVTGYRRQSVEKALLPCKLFIEKTDAPLEMLIVNNPNYRKGQFSSTKVGVAQVQDEKPFFISLADMPLITADHYKVLSPLLPNNDAVRPFSKTAEGICPGHPVLHAPWLKGRILECPDDYSVSRILKDCKVSKPEFDDKSWALDIDEASDYSAVL